MTTPMRRALLILASLVALAACRAHDAAPAPAPPPPADPPPEKPAAPEAVEPRFKAAAPGERLVILTTSAVQGYVAPCGCTKEPLGGVARFAGLVDEAHAAWGERVLFLDAGDLLFERADDNLPADRCQAEARVDLLLDTYARKGLAATALGPLDDARGKAFRDERLKSRDIPTVGWWPPRLGPREGLFVPHTTRAVGGVPVAITGVRADNDDDEAKARAFLEELAPQLKDARLTVVLAQAERARALRILADLPYDLAVLGHDPGEVPRAPERAGARGPVVVAAGAQAQNIGVVEVELEGRVAGEPLALDDRAATTDSRRKILSNRVEKMKAQVEEAEGDRKTFLASRLKLAVEELKSLDGPLPPMTGAHVNARAIALPRAAPAEAAAAEKLLAYEQAIPSLVKTCEADIVCPEPKDGAPVYVGAEACFLCHREAVKFWQQQKVVQQGTNKQGEVVEQVLSHAQAWDTLVDLGKESDRECIGCHSIGFNEPGGYCKASEVDFRINVQCESCHGPASEHVDSGGVVESLYPPAKGEAVCRRCHKVPHIPTTESFVYREKLRSILGPGHGEKRLEAILAGENP
jgi:hypothetical protein